MTPALLPALPQPAAPQSRDTAGALGIDAHRGPRAAREAETARAPRPVDPSAIAADPKLDRRRDEPVGPPPAFTVSLLQHLRDTAFDPPEPVTDTEAAGEPRTTEPADPPSFDRAAGRYSDERMLPPRDNIAPSVDLKL